jgi:hypothetical protein
MDAKDDIIQGLRLLTGYNRRTRIVPAEVISVYPGEGVCDVQDEEGNTIYDVRLRSRINEETDGLLLVPELNSWVLIGNVGGTDEEYVVLAAEAITMMSVQVETTLVTITSSGVSIQRGTDDLKSLLGDLLAAVKALTVTCAAPGSPSSPPLNLASFVALEARLNNLLD